MLEKLLLAITVTLAVYFHVELGWFNSASLSTVEQLLISAENSASQLR
jgi:hypothetical protein